MALGNFLHVRGPLTIMPFQVEAGSAATINAGEPVVLDMGGDTEYVTVSGTEVTDGDTFIGIAVSTSTDTTAADGKVYVAVPSAGTVYRGMAKTPANLATSQKLTRCVIDYTDPNYTIDTETTTNGIALVVDYDATAGWVDFMIDMSEYVNA